MGPEKTIFTDWQVLKKPPSDGTVDLPTDCQVGVNAELCDFIDAMALDKEISGRLRHWNLWETCEERGLTWRYSMVLPCAYNIKDVFFPNEKFFWISFCYHFRFPLLSFLLCQEQREYIRPLALKVDFMGSSWHDGWKQREYTIRGWLRTVPPDWSLDRSDRLLIEADCSRAELWQLLNFDELWYFLIFFGHL